MMPGLAVASSANLRRDPVPVSDKPAAVPAVAAPAGLVALASELPALLHLGTSSWSFPGWNGLVYDGDFREAKLARDGLEAYGKHPLMRTVSIDRTFYAPIAEADYARYASQVPEDFRFLVKAPMAITSSYLRTDAGGFVDSPTFLDPDYAISAFVAPCTTGLGSKCGPLVFQCPPQGRATTSNPDPFINRLYRFLKALPQGVLYAVEVRDPEILTERFFKCLDTTGVRFCIASHARMPAPRAQIERSRSMRAGPFVVRWSLHSGFEYETAKGKYFPFNRLVDEDPDCRESIARECVRVLDAGFPVYVVINNKAEGCAPLSVEKIAQRIVTLRTNLRNGA
jgi:uncharacterized protein YecE (DUF72 family)